ncbi:MAG: DNA polymerase IV [Balneolaceae bacterium]
MDPNRPHTYHPEENLHRITLYSTVAREHQHMSLKKRLYLHLDMNCFYAQVEQHAHNLYGFPVAMGGWHKEDGTPRGIVATASYEARALGIKTAMNAYEAWQICPWILFFQIDYDKYKGISRQLYDLLETAAPEVEGYSMDEYFLDVTHLLSRSRDGIESFARRLKEEIYRTLGLVCSIGVATSKTYAKLASDLEKPDGCTLVLSSDDVAQRLFPLQLDEVWGIGSRRYRKLRGQGIETIADAFRAGPAPFRSLFGSMQGQLFHEIVTGQDRARVLDHRHHVPDEVSYMHTFSDWSVDLSQVWGEVARAIRTVCYRLRAYRRKARKWLFHIRYQDVEWNGIHHLCATDGFTFLDDYLIGAAQEDLMRLLKQSVRNGYRIRGIGLRTVEMQPVDQADLFFQESEELRRLYRATDLINNTFGTGTIDRAASKEGVPGRTHFTERS